MNSILNDARFDKYFELLIETNEKINLTAITGREEVYKKHFYDSVLPEKLIPLHADVLDVGSGAGFPGIPLKLVRKDLNVTLLDSLKKRIDFLNRVINELAIDGIRAVHSRIEDLKERQNFDVVLTRAVAPLNTLCEYCLPFVKKGGFMLAYKGQNVSDEIQGAFKAASICGGGKLQVIEIPLDEQITRSFVIIPKEKDTPAKYPRGGNKPRLSPL